MATESFEKSGVCSEISAIATEIEEFKSLIDEVNEWLAECIATTSHGSLRGSGAASLKACWDSCLEYANTYGEALNTWVESINTQLAAFEKGDQITMKEFKVLSNNADNVVTDAIRNIGLKAGDVAESVVEQIK